MRLLVAALASLAAGCASLASEPPGAPGDAPALTRTGNPWADCYRRFQLEDGAAADVERLGQTCAAPFGLRFVVAHDGAPQRAGDAPERLAFRARRGCYRVFAIGGEGVRDLDVAVYDPRGNLAAGDVSRDAWPVVPPRGPLCVDEDGVYTVAVSVARGSGDYVLSIWGTAPAPRE